MIWTSSVLVAGMPMLGWDEYVFSPVTFSCSIHGLPGFHRCLVNRVFRNKIQLDDLLITLSILFNCFTILLTINSISLLINIDILLLTSWAIVESQSSPFLFLQISTLFLLFYTILHYSTQFYTIQVLFPVFLHHSVPGSVCPDVL